MNFYVDIEDAAGTKLGGGPLTSVTAWSYTARMDRAGSFSCTLLATDAQAAIIQRKRVIRAWSLLGTTWTEVGVGIIDAIERRPQVDGTVEMTLQGDDLIRELSYRSVQNLALRSGGNAVTHASAVSSVASYAPAGWSITADSAPPVNALYGRFNGESVLAALIQVGERSRAHFYRGTGRALTFASTFTASGVRAIQASGDLVPETCAITQMTQRQTSYDLITRIYPRGSGNADVQLTLAATTRTAGTGYTLDKTNNYIEHDAGVAAYGLIEAWLDYREVGPVSNSDADLQAAANALYDAALTELNRRVDEATASYYDLALAECSVLLRPMQTVRLVYRDLDAGLDVDADLNILEATWEVTSEGLRTTGLVVATVDRWPADDRDVIVGEVVQGRTYQSLPQLNANSYVTAYRAPVDADNMAAFRFRFGPEVVQVQQVLFEFQVLPLESTVTTIAGATSGSGAINTAAPSIDSTSATTNDSTGAGGDGSTDESGDGDTSSATPTIGASGSGDTSESGDGDTSSVTPTIGTTTLTISSTTLTIGTTTPTIGTTTPTIGSTTPTIGTTTPTIGSTSLTTQSTVATMTGVGLTTNSPSGGDIIASGRHEHSTLITLGSTVVYPIGFGAAGTSGGLVSNVSGSTLNLPVSQSGNHTHAINSHTHSIESHTHTINSHNHTIGAHNHTISAHNHTISAHNHTISAHNHTISAHDHTISAHDHAISAHTHTISAHTHTIGDHAHTIGAHTHTISAHTHTIGSHTHDLSAHTHSLNNHTHDLSESLRPRYGIFRESSAYTLTLAQMEYRVNGGSWTALSGATSAGDGWYQLDITSAVVSTSVVGRPLQSNNVLEVRAKPTLVDIFAGILLVDGGTSSARLLMASFPDHTFVVGDRIAVLGSTSAALAAYFGPSPQIMTVSAVGWASLTYVEVNAPNLSGPVGGGSTDMQLNHTALIDAQLSVRNVIQAIAYA